MVDVPVFLLHLRVSQSGKVPLLLQNVRITLEKKLLSAVECVLFSYTILRNYPVQHPCNLSVMCLDLIDVVKSISMSNVVLAIQAASNAYVLVYFSGIYPVIVIIGLVLLLGTQIVLFSDRLKFLT